MEAHDSGLSDADKEVAKGKIYKYSSYIETAHIHPNSDLLHASPVK